jgi:cell wall-associated NlpC family hydrolase
MPSSRSRWCLRSSVAVIPAVAVAALVTVPASATNPKDLKAQVAKLNDQLEQATETYNKYNVQLKASQTAADVAQQQATAAQAGLEQIRSKLRQMAAASYMNGGDEDWSTLVTSPNPSTMLGDSAALQYITSHKNTQVSSLLTAAQEAARATSTANDRKAQAQKLRNDAATQKAKIEKLLKDNKAKLAKQTGTSTSGGLAPVKVSGNASAKALAAVQAALSKRGKPYVYGAAGPNSFDCSGLTMWAYKQVGISLNHFTGDQVNEGTRISTSSLAPGDLVFFYSDHHHVGMYIGGNKMVDAPHTGTDVQVQSLAGRTITAAVRVA